MPGESASGNGQLSPDQQQLVDGMLLYPSSGTVRPLPEQRAALAGTKESFVSAETEELHQQLTVLLQDFEEQEADSGPQRALEAVTAQERTGPDLTALKQHVDGCPDCKARVARSTSRGAKQFFLGEPFNDES